jgi:serine/threonine protein kinase/Flp pilus assembly protein TadD
MGKGTDRLQCPQCFTLNPDDTQFCSKCGSSLSDLFETLTYRAPGQAESESVSQFTPGQMFDRRYRIIEEIGRGGMGRVFKAEDTELDITVALKIIRPHLSSNPRFIDQFKKEMLLARSISHENVIRIFDLGEAYGTKYISMEYIKGENLKEFLHASGTLAVETVIHMARQIGEALKVAHAKGIVHQDLKPSNIMVDQSGRVYIMDFGLAKAVYGAGLAKTGEGAGTPQYMSPEQAAGEKIGQASDIYSYGAVLYEMVTGKPMFEAETRAEYRKKHVSEKPVPPAKVNPHLPKPMEHIILKCLEKSQAERYQSIGEVLADLNRVEGEYRKVSFVEWLRRRWSYGLTAVLLTAMAALIYFVWLKPPPSPVPTGTRLSLAVMYLTNNTGDKSLDYMRRTLTELLIADLLQSQYVRVLTGDKIYEVLKALNLLDAPAYSSEELKNVAARAKVDYILQGNFTKANDRYRVNTSLHKADTLEPLASEQEEGVGEESMFSMVEGLTRRIKADFKLPAEALAKDIHKDLKKITTGSTKAFIYYVEGKRLYEEQKFEESLKTLNKAVSLDPEFAMAYRLIAENYSYLRNGEQYEKNLSKARSLLNRVPEREYYMIQAFAASSLQESIDLYGKLLSIYPDDADALGEMGAQYRNMEKWGLAAQQFEKVLTINDADELAYENLAVTYSAQGDYQKAIGLLESKLQVFSSWFGFHNRLATAYLCAHRYDRALEEARKAGTINPSDFEPVELEGLIHLVKGDQASAERSFRELVRSDNPQFQLTGRGWLCHLYLMQGRYDSLREEIKTGLEHARTAEMSPELRASEVHLMKILSAHVGLQMNDLPQAYEASSQALEAALEEGGRIDYVELSRQFRGLILAKMKRFEEARAAAEKLKQDVEKSEVQNELRHYHRLMGEIAREQGDLAKAIGSFETAVSLLPHQKDKFDLHILYLDSLASAYYQKGDLDKARNAYERILSLTTGRVRWGDLYSKSFYWLGKIHQAQNQKEKALGFYRRFLEIWSQADPGLPEIADARKQLAALGVQPSF